MSFRSIKYFIKEGVKFCIKRPDVHGRGNGKSLPCTVWCLPAFSMNLNYAASQVEAGYEIQLYIEETADSDDIQAVKSALIVLKMLIALNLCQKVKRLKSGTKVCGMRSFGGVRGR